MELHFSQVLSSKAYFKVCCEVHKIGCYFISCQSLLLGTNLPNDMLIENNFTFNAAISLHSNHVIVIAVVVVNFLLVQKGTLG